MASSICLSPNGQYLRREKAADAAGVLPGHLLIETATGVAVNATADDVPVRALFADINIGDAGDISRAYTNGENVHYVSASKGSYVTAILADSQTIAVGAETGEVAPAVPGRNLMVVSYVFVADAATTVTFKSATTAISGAMTLDANGGVSAESSDGLMWTEPGEALNITNSAGNISGHLTYRIV